MILSDAPVGSVVMLDWNREAVQIVEQSFYCTKIRSLRTKDERDGKPAEREVSTGTPTLEYDGKVLDRACACGCGRLVVSERNTRKYATSACRVRVSKRNGRGNGKVDHAIAAGNANSGNFPQ